MLELAILGLLKESDLHGYELKKRLTESLGPFSTVSFGSLYPALGRLEAAGAVKAVEAKEGPLPVLASPSLGAELAAFRTRRPVSLGVRSGRARKVYGITPKGQGKGRSMTPRGPQSAAEIVATRAPLGAST